MIATKHPQYMPKVDKELQPLVRELEQAGYQVVRAPGKGAHLIVQNEEGRRVYSLPSTPGRGRALQNLRAALKRKGLLDVSPDAREAT